MERADAILALDRMQGSNNAVTCPVDPSHGRLTPTGRITLKCQEKGCDYEMPVDASTVAEASERFRHDRPHLLEAAGHLQD